MSTIHSDYYTGELPVQTFLQNLHEILLPSCMDIFTITIIFFITSIHFNFQLFLYYARECSIIPELFSLKLQPIILKIMPTYSIRLTPRERVANTNHWIINSYA